MKTILGLDLGTTSIGWALIKEAEESDIIKTGVRVVPLSSDEIGDFEKGKSITTNANRTLKRSMRRNLQRYKLRRESLIQLLKESKLIAHDSLLTETSNNSTFETYKLRALAASKRIELDELARVLLMINKKRGYKSSRKAKNEDEGVIIDGMQVAKDLYEKNITPGQYSLSLLLDDKRALPDYYRSDLIAEFEKIWSFQSKFHPELTDEIKDKINGKTRMVTMSYFIKELKIEPIELKGKLTEKKLKRYELRAAAVSTQLELGELAEVFADLNGQINQSSGYLGAISDRSKELFFNQITIGQFLHAQIENNPHTRLKGQVFYRQDYLDEFEKIWCTQEQFHPQLTKELKQEIRDIIIFYQRRLKSQKSSLSSCAFESSEIEIMVDGKKTNRFVGPKVCPSSSPLFQEFRVWSQLNNLEIVDSNSGRKLRPLELDEKRLLFKELTFTSKLSTVEMNRILGEKHSFNLKQIDGNRTNASLLASYQTICELSGHDEINLQKLTGAEKLDALKAVFETIGISTNLLSFDSSLQTEQLFLQPHFMFWHLLYSFEGDNSKSGVDKLLDKLETDFGFPREYGKIISNTTFEKDYSSLSTRAIRKILPYLNEGERYDIACGLAGYNHSNSEDAETRKNKQLKDKLEILPKNSLRNPVVEKIINQMINVVNGVIETHGKPDEIRLEMARELKKNAVERDSLTKAVAAAGRENKQIIKILQTEFNVRNVSKNDITRYKLYEELRENGYKTLYSNKLISKEMLYNGQVDIEHIIPQSRLFDDSFSNKTLEFRQVNIKKGNATAYDFVKTEYGEEALAQYEERVKRLFNKDGKKGKLKKLLWEEKDIPSDFINRDLQDTRYISKKAKEILSEVIREVNTTTGSITARLRDDWQLTHVLEELNLPKFKELGLVELKEGKNGERKSKIINWTKRNDHRHHAMDAITVAFTKPSYIQYLNNLNARSDKNTVFYAIQDKETKLDEKGKRRFKPPIEINLFRAKVKEHLENTLVSFKAKNKVTTSNKNIIKTRNGKHTQVISTPRGQLHKETLYGSSLVYVTKHEKVNASFDETKLNTVAKKKYREALLKRLIEFNNDPKKAFTGKNSLDKNPIYLDELKTMTVPVTVKTVALEPQYTIRKSITPDLKIDKVVDVKIRHILTNRINEFGGDAKKAFANLEENPIWLNKEKGIQLKTVTVLGVSNAEALHTKKDHFGKEILDAEGRPIPTDFISTGNNHHVAIYKDENGNLQEEVVSLMEAVTRKNQDLDVIKRKHEKGWEFLFTMKQNEYFVFPNKEQGFNPIEIDLTDPKNNKLISKNLFRVQKIATRDYFFRHHLETILEDNIKTKGLTWKRLGLNGIEHIVKVRLNHLGEIIHVGE
jgi:CRISPR-associated endonuclease Csn1